MNAVVEQIGKPSFGRVWSVSWRVICVTLGAWFAADVISDIAKTGGSTRLNIATTGVAAASVVAFFTDMVSLGKNCWKYLGGGSNNLSDLATGFWKAWASLTLIFISYGAWASPKSPDPMLIVYTHQPEETLVERRVSAVPALYRRDAKKDWSEGVAFNETELDVSIPAIERILAAYVACGSAPGKSQVAMTIEGFASSQFFDVPKIEDSNLLNVETANRRAWNAYCFVAQNTPVDFVNRGDWADSDWKCPSPKQHPSDAVVPIKLKVTHWDKTQAGFEKMMKSRPIQDWPDDLTDTQRRFAEELTRRVDFYLTDAGACQVNRPILTAQAVAPGSP